MKRIAFFLTAFLLFLAPLTVAAQGWEKTVGGNANEQGYSIAATPDGGFILTGYQESILNGQTDVYLIKTDAEGRTLWAKTFGGSNYDDGAAVVVAPDGGYVVTGYTKSAGAGGKDVYLFKTDALGNLLWEKTFGGTAFDQAYALAITSDGGYAITGYTLSSGNGQYDVILIRTDASGNAIWNKTYGSNASEIGKSVAVTPDGGFIVSGYRDVNGQLDALLLKTDADGNQEWMTYPGGADRDEASSAIPVEGGGYLMAGYTKSYGNGASDAYLVHTDAEGNEIWHHTYGDTDYDIANAILPAIDGGYILAGSLSNPQTSKDDCYVIHIDPEGNPIWSKTYGGVENESGAAVISTGNADGYAICGFTNSFGAGAKDVYLIRMDVAGNRFANRVYGQVFFDNNNNCISDDGESPLQGWLVKITGSTTTFGTTDANGNFNILLDTGAYQLTLVTPNNYWQSCAGAYTFTFTQPYESTQLNFPAEVQTLCAGLDVDIAAPVLTPCNNSRFTVHYRNRGTATANNAYVEVLLDPELDFTSADLPLAAQNGNLLRFDLGDIGPDQVGSFHLNATLGCNAIPGAAHSTSARIFPNAICASSNPGWTGAHISVDYSNDVDSVGFIIKNDGTGPTGGEIQYIVIEDEIIYRADAVMLNPGDSTITKVPANGSTWRLQAQQAAGYPDRSNPSVTVEGATGNSGNPPHLGFYCRFPQDDASPFVGIDYQPNATTMAAPRLTGYPLGRELNHYIEPNTDLEYVIYFKNSGPAPLSDIIIIDTLTASLLDVASLDPGAASHPYSFEISGNGVLRFHFNNITLPPGEAGFVKFRIAQQLNLPSGTQILNRAAIYPDFGVPQLTSYSRHVIMPLSVAVVGLVTTETQQGVINAVVNVQDIGLDVSETPDTTNQNGFFGFRYLQPGADYIFKPYKNADPLNGVSSLDLVRIMRHILGLEILGSPYKLIAADVNHSDGVTMSDVVELRKMILHVLDTFPHNKSWRFVDAAYLFPDPANPFAPGFPEEALIDNIANDTKIDFIGIKTGDVDNSVQANQWSGGQERGASTDAFEIQSVDQFMPAGSDKNIAFRLPCEIPIYGLQLTIVFDPTRLEYLGFSAGQLALKAEHLGLQQISEGIITLSWSQATALTTDAGAPLFALLFHAKTNVNAAAALHFASRPTAAEIYPGKGQEITTAGVLLSWERAAGPCATDLYFEAYPNPAVSDFRIDFRLPVEGPVDVQLYNAFGQPVKSLLHSKNLPANHYSLPVRRGDLPEGMYYLRLNSGELSRMISVYLL